jgi:hypothetical protein
MRFTEAGLVFLVLAVPIAPAAPQASDIVVRGVAARTEIERILEADNVDTSRLSSRAVAEALATIDRGGAPNDFWAAYQVHVAAWVRLADVETALSKHRVPMPEDVKTLAIAEAAIGESFDQVERIARRYGARLPTPRWRM